MLHSGLNITDEANAIEDNGIFINISFYMLAIHKDYHKLIIPDFKPSMPIGYISPEKWVTELVSYLQIRGDKLNFEIRELYVLYKESDRKTFMKLRELNMYMQQSV